MLFSAIKLAGGLYLLWFALLGGVAVSIVWRLLLSHAFSRAVVRRGYARIQRALERLVGIALRAFGARLVYEGLTRR